MLFGGLDRDLSEVFGDRAGTAYGEDSLGFANDFHA